MAANADSKNDLQVTYHDDKDVLEKGASSSDDGEFQDDPERAKRILRAVDLRVVPVLTLLVSTSIENGSLYSALCLQARSWQTYAGQWLFEWNAFNSTTETRTWASLLTSDLLCA